MKQKMTNKRWLWEFSKRLVICCAVFYFVAMSFACVVMICSEYYEALPILIENISQMLQVCVFGYFAKAGIENTFKIKLNTEEEE